MYKSLKIIALFLILLTSSCSEQDTDNSSIPENTQVSGKISSDTVWTLDKSPYIVVDDVVVERDVTLTIEPQVEIRFDRGKGLTVKGILIANGSAGFTPSDESELIKFTSNQLMPDKGDWRGIKFDNTNDDKSIISYSKIQYAKIGIDCFSSSPLISDNFIESNEVGIKATDSFSNITHNAIRSNTYGIILITQHLTPNIYQNTISHNEIGIELDCANIHSNNLVLNAAYSIKVRRLSYYGCKINAQNNWWGTTEIKEIEDKIYHVEDKKGLNRVRYIPYADTEISDAYPRVQKRNTTLPFNEKE